MFLRRFNFAWYLHHQNLSIEQMPKCKQRNLKRFVRARAPIAHIGQLHIIVDSALDLVAMEFLEEDEESLDASWQDEVQRETRTKTSYML